MTTTTSETDSGYAWFRLSISLLVSTIGSGGVYIVVVVLPAVQAEFDVARGDASLPFTFTLIGFGLGGMLMGRLTDRFGVAPPLIFATIALSLGFVAAAAAPDLLTFTVAHGLLIGLLGCSATFSPLVTDISFWFTRRRGIAVAVCASGNFLAGTVWPPLTQYFVELAGWRQTYVGIAVFCLVTMLPLTLLLRRRAPGRTRSAAHEARRGQSRAEASAFDASAADAPAFRASTSGASVLGAAVADAPASTSSGTVSLEPAGPRASFGLSPAALQTLLCIAGIACCVAMAMPQVHIVAYCGDLGYGPARGAQMLSLMFGFGIVSRLGFGLICDRIGGLRTLLLGSLLQGIALLLFLPFDSLVSLYLISALFGLFQGGIVPAYAIIVREHFAPRDAGLRVGTVLTATSLGMALGGWLSGVIFDLTGSYDAAFVHGIAWNALNLAIAAWLLHRRQARAASTGFAAAAASAGAEVRIK